MNIAVTSKEEILEISRKLVSEKGLASVNMRTVANACGVAVGSVYNYFPSKAVLLSATIEAVWKDIFCLPEEILTGQSFTDYLSRLFERVRTGGEKYPEFLTVHALNFASEDKQTGRQTMEDYFIHLKQNLLTVLEHDDKVRNNIWNEILTPEVFADYIFTLFLSVLFEKQNDCQALIELVKKLIYE